MCLTTLSLAHNRLTAVPSAALLESVTDLDASHNKLRALSVDLSEETCLDPPPFFACA